MKLFDAHLHIIDPRFPLVENQGYLPPVFSVDDYLAQMEGVDLVGGAVVSGSFQGFDQGYLAAALSRLGRGYVGVTQLPATVSDRRLRELDRLGVRAVRFNVRRGGPLDLGLLDRTARRVHERLGWHVELYLDAAELTGVAGLAATLAALPAVCIDHLGLSKAGLPALLKLVSAGVRVKASGFSRGDLDPLAAIRAIVAANDRALMFGSDLPSTRAPRRYSRRDLDLVIDGLPVEQVERVLYRNAQAFYRPRPSNAVGAA